MNKDKLKEATKMLRLIEDIDSSIQHLNALNRNDYHLSVLVVIDQKNITVEEEDIRAVTMLLQNRLTARRSELLAQFELM